MTGMKVPPSALQDSAVWMEPSWAVASLAMQSFAKTEAAIESMADGDNKWAAEKEIAAAQDAMLNNKGGCTAHLNKALRDTAAK